MFGWFDYNFIDILTIIISSIFKGFSFGKDKLGILKTGALHRLVTTFHHRVQSNFFYGARNQRCRR